MNSISIIKEFSARLDSDIFNLADPDNEETRALHLKFIIGDCLDIIREAAALLSSEGGNPELCKTNAHKKTAT